MPSVGNHEYHTPDASGYFGYFGARAGAPSKGYYSYKRGSWRVVVLNSNCSQVGGCGAHSPQGRWLEQILTNYPSRCTLAYFHHPLFASTGAATTQVRPFWNILYRHNADVILSGHTPTTTSASPRNARTGRRICAGAFASSWSAPGEPRP